jgi:type I restriction enzyme M protein
MSPRKTTRPAKGTVDASIVNDFCRADDLMNEASVESFFVLRLLAALGYEDSEIKTKRSIDERKIARGSKRERHKPDHLIVCGRKPRWLVEVKGTNENVDDHVYQGAGYAFQINREDKSKPVTHFMMTNGLYTRVYAWEQSEPVLSLKFADFKAGNNKYEALRLLLGAAAVRRGAPRAAAATGPKLTRPALSEVKRAFLRCHHMIYKGEKVSPQAAFLAFAKLLFVKLWEDRRLRDDPTCMAAIANGDQLPENAVRFSSAWIEKQEANDLNPIDTVLFRQLVEQLEAEIARKKRKRIFAPSERLNLSPGTVKRVVAELESWYLFGIDEDLNGRMFEAFLAATMRGRELGQYFTPRSVVKLISRLARPEASRKIVERVLDACCGTGGFLIEALTDMRNQVYANTSLSKREQEQLLNEIANEAIFGIDAGRDPTLSRIARINMYLHGDGGSRVYVADSLADPPRAADADALEDREDVSELKRLIDNGLEFDVILSNPPFSMTYQDSVPDEAAILNGYELKSHGGANRKSLLSAVMFLERYHRFLRPGGRLLTVIDDSTLSGPKTGFVRDYLRANYLVRGVISLHGDAFQRAQARVKTSILCLEKKQNVDDEQPAAFVYETRYVGIDDVVPKTPPSEAEEARQLAAEEMKTVVDAYSAYLRGEAGPWLVPAERLRDRLDAKHLQPWSVMDLAAEWKRVGADVAQLDALVDVVDDQAKINPAQRYSFLKVTYAGRAERGESRLGDEISYQRVRLTQRDTIVVSHIRAVDKAICVIDEDTEGLVVSSEFTILRKKPKAKVDLLYLWSVLRSAAVVANLLSSASGQARFRINWELLRMQRIPLLPAPQQRKIGDAFRSMLEHEREISRCAQAGSDELAILGLDGDTARDRLERAKPPT